MRYDQAYTRFRDRSIHDAGHCDTLAGYSLPKLATQSLHDGESSTMRICFEEGKTFAGEMHPYSPKRQSLN